MPQGHPHGWKGRFHAAACDGATDFCPDRQWNAGLGHRPDRVRPDYQSHRNAAPSAGAAQAEKAAEGNPRPGRIRFTP